MARVRLRVPELRLNLQDVIFVVHNTDKSKLGELHLSTGSVDWWPRNAKRRLRLRWSVFADEMDKLAERRKPRTGRRWHKSTQPKN